MITKNLSKKLREILYKNDDPQTLTTEFERVLSLHECDYDITCMESNRAVIVDISPCIQFCREKGPNKKVYEVIPFNSPLKQQGGRYYAR